MARKRVKKQPVVIRFLDHSLYTGDEARPIECEVYGLLYHEDSKAYYVASWICDDVINDANSEVFTIVKHPGVVVRTLRASSSHGPAKPRLRQAKPRRSSRRRVPRRQSFRSRL